MQYEDEKVSDMCGYVIKNLYGLQSIEGLGSGRAIEVVLRDVCSKQYNQK